MLLGLYNKYNQGLSVLPGANVAEYQFQTAAQVIDQRTAVGLARTAQVDLRFFLPPPPLPDLEEVYICEHI